jgi:hypothetical protein
MDSILAQTDTARMRAHGDAEPTAPTNQTEGLHENNSAVLLRCHQQNAQHLTHARKPTRVDLYYVDRLGLQELFEYHSIMGVFPRSNANPIRFESLANGSMAKDVVRRSRLFNKPSRTAMSIYTQIVQAIIYQGLMGSNPFT